MNLCPFCNQPLPPERWHSCELPFGEAPDIIDVEVTNHAL